MEPVAACRLPYLRPCPPASVAAVQRENGHTEMAPPSLHAATRYRSNIPGYLPKGDNRFGKNNERTEDGSSLSEPEVTAINVVLAWDALGARGRAEWPLEAAVLLSHDAPAGR